MRSSFLPYDAGNLSKTDAEITAVASSLAKDMNSYIGQTGEVNSTAYMRAFTDIGVPFPVIGKFLQAAGIDAKGKFQGGMTSESQKATNVNLYTKAAHLAQTHALKEGTQLGYSGERLQSYVAGRIGQFNNVWMQEALKDKTYGAGLIPEAIHRTGAPYYSVSEEEQKNRFDIARERIRQKVEGK
jgi:hypothetical protein